ncbi:MAG: transposase [Leptolyngbya sp. SIO4C5]|nr:transposase [Leptolyngbya sp. SIO4C5]
MAPSKLSDADKQAIIEIYKQPGETTSTIGDRFGVSNSTISRVLKSSLPAEEYSALIQQKRSSSEPAPAPKPSEPEPAAKQPTATKTDKKKTAKKDTKKASPPPAAEEATVAAATPSDEPETEKPTTKQSPAKPKLKSKTPAESVPEPPSEEASVAASAAETASSPEPGGEPIETVEIPPTEISVPRRRRRSRSPEESEEDSTQLPLLKTDSDKQTAAPILKTDADKQAEAAPAAPELKGKTAQPATAVDEEDEDEELPTPDDDYGDDLDEDDEDDGDDWDENDEALQPHLQGNAAIEIVPLTEASLPKTCYLVVDRIADLITRPLREFGELGQIPESEIDERTLPIFDNHRVARRFSRRNQRVVKIPDGEILHKTGRYLHAKGITRLLIDGQVYSLASEEN